MKKKAYMPSKAISERANAILGEMRRKQAVEDLSRSNKKMGLVVPKSLDVSTSESNTTTTKTTQTSSE